MLNGHAWHFFSLRCTTVKGCARQTRRSDGRKRSTTRGALEGKEKPKPELVDLAKDST